jgi:hypothetical protein
VTEQRREFVERIKELQPDVSFHAIGDAMGVAHTTISRGAGANAPHGEEESSEIKDDKVDAGANAPLGAADGKRDAARIGVV